jgi:hypothetical protein
MLIHIESFKNAWKTKTLTTEIHKFYATLTKLEYQNLRLTDGILKRLRE